MMTLPAGSAGSVLVSSSQKYYLEFTGSCDIVRISLREM